MKTVVPVTVVVPCHNAAATVARAMTSIASQTVQPLEVIVVDDGSTDETRDVLESLVHHDLPFPVRQEMLTENRGPGDARNVGCGLADGHSRYIAFLDADDAWFPMKLERQIGWMESRPEVAWTAHRCGIIGRTPLPTPAVGEPMALPITRRGLLVRNPVATPSVVVRVPTPVRFRPGWRWCEDLMLWIDWIDAGYAGAMIDEELAALGRPPRTPGGSTGNLRAMYDGERKVVQTLVAERRMPLFCAAAWRCYAWARYIRRVVAT